MKGYIVAFFFLDNEWKIILAENKIFIQICILHRKQYNAKPEGKKMCWNTSVYWGETWSMLVRIEEPLEYKHKEEETSVSVN